MIIRPATPFDLHTIIDFQQRMALETENLTLDISVVTLGARQVFSDPAKGKYYVAEEGEHLVGCLMTTFEWSEWRNGNILWIQSVYIDKAFRGQGVFTKLYEHIRLLVNRDPALRGIRLYVDEKNKAAQEVYRRLEMDGGHYRVFEWMKKDISH